MRDAFEAAWQRYAHEPAVLAAANPEREADALSQMAELGALKRLDALYPDIPPEAMLSRVSRDEQVQLAVRRVLAANPATPRATLLALARDFPAQFFTNPAFVLYWIEDPGLLMHLERTTQERLLSCAEAPLGFVRQMQRHSQPELAQAAAMHILMSEANPLDWEEQVATIVADYPFAKPYYGDHYQLETVFGLPGVVPNWLLDSLAQQKTFELQTVVRVLSDRFPERAQDLTGEFGEYLQSMRDLWYAMTMPPTFGVPVRLNREITTNLNLSAAKLAELAQDGAPDIRLSVAFHPNTTPATLDRLADDNIPMIALTAARRPIAPARTLRRIYLRYLRTGLPTSPLLYRVVALAGEAASPRQLEAHSAAPNWLIRLAIARNPRTPTNIMRHLANDGNSLVSTAARSMVQQAESAN